MNTPTRPTRREASRAIFAFTGEALPLTRLPSHYGTSCWVTPQGYQLSALFAFHGIHIGWRYNDETRWLPGYEPAAA